MFCEKQGIYNTMIYSDKHKMHICPNCQTNCNICDAWCGYRQTDTSKYFDGYWRILDTNYCTSCQTVIRDDIINNGIKLLNMQHYKDIMYQYTISKDMKELKRYSRFLML